MQQKHYIYGLIDPTTKGIRYIGKTIDLAHRYRGHINERGDSRKCKWITGLVRIEKKPIMVVLEETTINNVSAAEQKWIDMAIKLGWNITNTAGVSDDYDEIYKKVTKREAEAQDVEKHIEFPRIPPCGASSYKPEYLLEKLKNNFYRPIFFLGELVMLARGETPGWASLVMVEDFEGYPHFRYRYSIPFSDLPLYAVASLFGHVDDNGGNPKYQPGIRPCTYRNSPSYYDRQVEILETFAPTTGRTFYAALD